VWYVTPIRRRQRIAATINPPCRTPAHCTLSAPMPCLCSTGPCGLVIGPNELTIPTMPLLHRAMRPRHRTKRAGYPMPAGCPAIGRQLHNRVRPGVRAHADPAHVLVRAGQLDPPDRRVRPPYVKPIARSGVTVTRLLCDPLPYKNVLRYRTRQNVGGISNLDSNTKCTRECAHILPGAVLRI
jgi:hypothetical protein